MGMMGSRVMIKIITLILPVNPINQRHSKQHSHPHPNRLLPPRGDYQTLLSFQKAEVVYGITFHFAHKYLSKGDRTVEQMIQSARSGRQNILEGSKAATTSKETEIKLTNGIRASLEETIGQLPRLIASL